MATRTIVGGRGVVAGLAADRRIVVAAHAGGGCGTMIHPHSGPSRSDMAAFADVIGWQVIARFSRNIGVVVARQASRRG